MLTYWPQTTIQKETLSILFLAMCNTASDNASSNKGHHKGTRKTQAHFEALREIRSEAYLVKYSEATGRIL